MTTQAPTQIIDEAKVRDGTAKLLRGMSSLAAATADAVERGDEVAALLLTFQLAEECNGFLGAVSRAVELAAELAARPPMPEGTC